MGGQDLLGRRLGGFELTEVLGTGGFATVYRARQERLDREVAVKVLAPDLARNVDAARRFEREGRAAASLDHPAIVPVYDAGDEDGIVYLAMRLVGGPTLGDELATGSVDRSRLVTVLAPVADALDHAHTAGLVHRDVKPSNVLLEGDRVWLADFGIAASARDVGRYTTGAIGTAAYMAPEQAAGDDLDGRADQYALACVAFEGLTGTPPFGDADLLATLLAHRDQPIPSAGDDQVDGVLGRGLAKDPDDRFGSCRDLVEALGDALGVRVPPPVQIAGGEAAVTPASGGDVGATAPTAVIDLEPGDPAPPRTAPLPPTEEAEPHGDAGRAPGPGPTRTRSWWAVAGAVAVALLLGAVVVTASGDDDGGTDLDPPAAPIGPSGGDASVAWDFPLTSLNPHLDVDAAAVLSGHVLPTFSTLDAEGRPVPSLLADAPEVIDGTPSSVRYRLRDDAVWDDGTPVTSADVVATWAWLVDPATQAVSADLYQRIADIEVIDDHELIVRYDEPQPLTDLLFSTNHPVLKAADLDAYLEEGGDPARYLIDERLSYSAGPYQVVGWDPGVRVTLARNEAFWGDPPELDRITVRQVGDDDAQLAALAEGDADVAWLRSPDVTQVAEARRLDGVTVEVGGSDQWATLVLNTREGTGPTTDPVVRAALATAIDRQALVDALVTSLTGETASPAPSLVWSPEHPDATAADAFARYDGDEDAAGRLLDEAGWVVGPDGIRQRDGARLSLEVLYEADHPATALQATAITAMAQQVDEAGIELTARPVEGPGFDTALGTGDFQVALFTLYATPDPADAVLRLSSARCPVTVPGCAAARGANYGAWSSREADAALAASDAELDPPARRSLLAEVDRIAATEVPGLPLFALPAFVAHRNDLLGVEVPPLRGGPLLTLEGWHWATPDPEPTPKDESGT